MKTMINKDAVQDRCSANIVRGLLKCAAPLLLMGSIGGIVLGVGAVPDPVYAETPVQSDQKPAEFGAKIWNILGKQPEKVIQAFGKTEINNDSKMNKIWGANKSMYFSGAFVNSEAYLKGLDFARTMGCFFDKDGCYVAIFGIEGLEAIESGLGMKIGSLKIGKTLLNSKDATVFQVVGTPYFIYATAWGNPKDRKNRIAQVWISKTKKDPKFLTSSI